MVITVSVNLMENETIDISAGEAADQILTIFNGNLEKDYCTVHVMSPPEPGSAGQPPGPSEPPSE